ncbi:hypothetical protein L2K70_15970 [Nocardioides KLBMP 9356]|uniref:LppX_LprAFG lipoprotein n=1 Tax=Nocardioides potassii TaxID=2911371 RepID=A0ABS9HFW2_9ACTN|nr:hypothetical protein [Nocardioides potassii]MCF6379115.1 hypothetical protein [Nocardioides potassii]
MRVHSLSRRLGAAALVLTVGAGVSACGSDSGGSEDSSSSASDGSGSDDSATDEATDSSDDSTDTSGDESADGSLTELSADDFYPTVLGALQDAGTFRFTTTSESAGQSQEMSGEARFGDDGVEMKASGTGAQAMDMILIDQAMYMKSDAFGTGDKWLKIDLSDPNSLFGMIGKATDPEVMFKAMESPKKLELVGTEDVDGVETNHYRITMDPTSYLKAMEFPAAMADMLPKELVTEMWVDGDNLPRKFTQTTEIKGVAGGPATTSNTEGTYSDFGTDVDIEAPPASEVTEQPGM